MNPAIESYALTSAVPAMSGSQFVLSRTVQKLDLIEMIGEMSADYR
jgi:hypothetical protein